MSKRAPTPSPRADAVELRHAVVALHRIAQRDDAALERLFDLFHPLVYVQALRLTKCVTTAEAITHRVFLHIWRCPNDYDGGSLPAWITSLTRRFSAESELQSGAE